MRPLRYRSTEQNHSKLFKSALVEASKSPTPVYVGRIALPRSRVEQLLEEGRQRTEMNRRRLGAKFLGHRQAIKGCPLTVDELGRLAEGAVESLIALQAEAVVEGTDKRPDGDLEGLRFDVKSSYARPGHSFAIADYLGDKYDAVVLVELSADRKLHVWACKAEASDWEKRRGVGGGRDFYLVRCPAPETIH